MQLVLIKFSSDWQWLIRIGVLARMIVWVLVRTLLALVSLIRKRISEIMPRMQKSNWKAVHPKLSQLLRMLIFQLIPPEAKLKVWINKGTWCPSSIKWIVCSTSLSIETKLTNLWWFRSNNSRRSPPLYSTFWNFLVPLIALWAILERDQWEVAYNKARKHSPVCAKI